MWAFRMTRRPGSDPVIWPDTSRLIGRRRTLSRVRQALDSRRLHNITVGLARRVAARGGKDIVMPD